MGGFEGDGRRIGAAIGLAFGAFMHAVVSVFVFTSGLVAAAWAWVLLVVLWCAGVVLLWRWRRSPARTLAIPVVMAAIWWATMTAGDVWLGWTA